MTIVSSLSRLEVAARAWWQWRFMGASRSDESHRTQNELAAALDELFCIEAVNPAVSRSVQRRVALQKGEPMPVFTRLKAGLRPPDAFPGVPKYIALYGPKAEEDADLLRVPQKDEKPLEGEQEIPFTRLDLAEQREEALRAELERVYGEVASRGNKVMQLHDELKAKQRVLDWEDAVDEWTDAIKAAHPIRSGAHEQYGVAMKMVNHRHSKGELVALVTWLLTKQTAMEAVVAQARNVSPRICGATEVLHDKLKELDAIHDAKVEKT